MPVTITITITRTYETFAIKWADGGRWSPYTQAEAQGIIDRSPRAGEVERRTFDVTFTEDRAHMYKPGIAETRSTS